ncbi:MAG: ATP-binding protein [Clostridia bacterium]
MRKRIYRGFMLLALVSALLVGIFSAIVGVRLSEEQLKGQLLQELTMLSALEENTPSATAFMQEISKLNVPNRLTWIASDGRVRYDNQSHSDAMGNHLSRQEIVMAGEKGVGYAKRFSNTLLEEQLYCAQRLKDGSYLRIAATQRTIGGYLQQMAWFLILSIVLVLLAAALISRAWTSRLVRPINEMNLEEPLSNRVYDELSPMLRRMAEQNRKLDAQLQELSDRRNELDTIIGHMNEGLIILDEHKHVLMMNDSARGTLHTDQPIDGHTALAIYNRSQTLLDTLDAAMKEGNAHADMSANGREYLLTASMVRHCEGVVLLVQDVTEQNRAEQARKRFTANVSHELRTPLTTIGGYAELLQNGMAQAQDVPVFARKIYDESRRLLRLVEDILHLSKLDEGFIAGKLQRLDLFEVAKEALRENEETAKERNVTLKLRGESTWVQGDPTLLDEMLRNVIENGVKYNHSNGLVEVAVSHENGKARVSVADTGIGIPQEHLEQVFERFYRVDGSRSKQSGGTGLGLSIVKHGAEYHQAKIEMKSELGAGTTVQMIFDAADAKNEC